VAVLEEFVDVLMFVDVATAFVNEVLDVADVVLEFADDAVEVVPGTGVC